MTSFVMTGGKRPRVMLFEVATSYVGGSDLVDVSHDEVLMMTLFAVKPPTRVTEGPRRSIR